MPTPTQTDTVPTTFKVEVDERRDVGLATVMVLVDAVTDREAERACKKLDHELREDLRKRAGRLPVRRFFAQHNGRQYRTVETHCRLEDAEAVKWVVERVIDKLFPPKEVNPWSP